MSFWTINLVSLDGGTTEVTAAPFRSARVTWAIDGPGSAEFALMPDDVDGGTWLYGRRRIIVKDGAGTARFGGWLDRLERGGAPGAVTYRAASRGLGVHFDERVVHGDFSQTSVVATSIVTAIIGHMTAQTNDASGFTTGTVTGTAPARTRYFCDGDVLGDLIRELAEMSSGGFDWEVSPVGAVNMWVGGRGTDRSGTYTIHDTDVNDWQLSCDTSDMRTYMTGLGDYDDSQPCGPPLVIDFTSDRTTYGRRESVMSDATEDDGEMEEKTTDALRAIAASTVQLTTTWIEGTGPWSFGTVWLGDIVAADLGAAFGGTRNVRCTTIEVALEPGTHEFVTMTWEAA